MTGTTLRICRIVVSMTVMAVLTASLSGASCVMPSFAGWIESVQILPAVAAFSLLTFVVWLVVTLLFGRIYCSTLCPLGTFQDIFARIPRLTSRRASIRRYTYRRPSSRLQYGMLLLAVVCLMAGFMYVTDILDPYTVYADMIGRCAVPAAEASRNGVAMIGDSTGWWNLPPVKIVIASLGGSAVSFVIMLIVAITAARNGRLLCNTVCPVGTTLGFVSRYAVCQIDIDTDKCIQCGRCSDVCKSGCVNLTDHTVDGARCVVCFDCLTVCPNDAIHYTSDRKRLSDPMMQRIDKAGEGATAAAAGTGDCSQTLPTIKTTTQK